MLWLTERNMALQCLKRLPDIRFRGPFQTRNPRQTHSKSRSTTRTDSPITKRSISQCFLIIWIFKAVHDGKDASSVKPLFTISHYHGGVSKVIKQPTLNNKNTSNLTSSNKKIHIVTFSHITAVLSEISRFIRGDCTHRQPSGPLLCLQF